MKRARMIWMRMRRRKVSILSKSKRRMINTRAKTKGTANRNQVWNRNQAWNRRVINSKNRGKVTWIRLRLIMRMRGTFLGRILVFMTVRISLSMWAGNKALLTTIKVFHRRKSKLRTINRVFRTFHSFRNFPWVVATRKERWEKFPESETNDSESLGFLWYFSLEFFDIFL
jgi:hypothetical protein